MPVLPSPDQLSAQIEKMLAEKAQRDKKREQDELAKMQAVAGQADKAYVANALAGRRAALKEDENDDLDQNDEWDTASVIAPIQHIAAAPIVLAPKAVPAPVIAEPVATQEQEVVAPKSDSDVASVSAPIQSIAPAAQVKAPKVKVNAPKAVPAPVIVEPVAIQEQEAVAPKKDGSVAKMRERFEGIKDHPYGKVGGNLAGGYGVADRPAVIINPVNVKPKPIKSAPVATLPDEVMSPALSAQMETTPVVSTAKVAKKQTNNDAILAAKLQIQETSDGLIFPDDDHLDEDTLFDIAGSVYSQGLLLICVETYRLELALTVNGFILQEVYQLQMTMVVQATMNICLTDFANEMSMTSYYQQHGMFGSQSFYQRQTLSVREQSAGIFERDEQIAQTSFVR